MGVDPVTISLIAGGLGAAFGTYSSVEQARKQNDAVRKSKAAAENAAKIQSRQLTEQEAQQRAARIQEARRLRASILAAGGASGFDLSSGDFTDAVTASDAFASQDLVTLATNLQSNLDRVSSGLDAQIISLNARRESVGASGLTGGLAGLSAGLSLGQNVDRIVNDPARQEEILSIRRGTQGGFPVT